MRIEQRKKRLAVLREGNFSFKKEYSLLFIPALFFIALGGASLVAPKLIGILFASFFIVVGALLGFLTWKFLLIKKKIDRFVKDLEGKVLIHNISVHDRFDSAEDRSDGKKILYH